MVTAGAEVVDVAATVGDGVRIGAVQLHERVPEGYDDCVWAEVSPGMCSCCFSVEVGT